jgi:hypothetical protein
MYDEHALLVPNALDRYLIRPDSDGLAMAPDGSLTIRCHRDPPAGAPSGNWLPAPDGPFTLALRVYSPAPAVLDGSWLPPALEAPRVTPGG